MDVLVGDTIVVDEAGWKHWLEEVVRNTGWNFWLEMLVGDALGTACLSPSVDNTGSGYWLENWLEIMIGCSGWRYCLDYCSNIYTGWKYWLELFGRGVGVGVDVEVVVGYKQG